MNVELLPLPVFDCDRKNFRFEPRAAAGLARFARHERSDPVPGEFALRLLVKSLHLWHQSFERAFLFAVAAETHFNWHAVGAEVERALKGVRQFRERRVFVDLKMFHQRAL